MKFFFFFWCYYTCTLIAPKTRRDWRIGVHLAIQACCIQVRYVTGARYEISLVLHYAAKAAWRHGLLLFHHTHVHVYHLRLQIWMECGSACTPTCDDPAPLCTLQCVARCQCPAGDVLHKDSCMPASQCPSSSPVTASVEATCPDFFCDLDCPFGFVYDDNQCPLCQCRPHPCQVSSCVVRS